MQLISSSIIQTWERFYRANFINFLTGFKAQPICSNGIDGYYSTSLIDRYHYAKQGSEIQKTH